MAVIIGCCGYSVKKEIYYDNFKVMELQQIFYKFPQEATIFKWRSQAPEDFEFCLKASQLITHSPSSPTYRRLKPSISPDKKKNYGFFRPTKEVMDAWESTRKYGRQLRAKIIIFQCPASFTPIDENKENMRKFFSAINRDDFIFAWEPRGNWQPQEIKQLCQQLKLIYCVDPVKMEPTYGQIAYFRLHGIGGYRYQYRDEQLKRVWQMSRNCVDAYVMFNNIYMFEDALRFLRISLK